MKKLMLTFMTLVLAVACSKDSDSSSQTGDSSSQTIAKAVFPKKIIFKNTLGEIYLVQNHTFADGKIQKIEKQSYDPSGALRGGSTQILTYDGDLVVKIESEDAAMFDSYTLTYTYDSDKKLVKKVETRPHLTEPMGETTYSYDNGILVAEKRVERMGMLQQHTDYSYTYNGNIITETRKNYSVDNGVQGFIFTSTVTYTIENDNLVKQVYKYSNGDVETFNFSYDNKNNPNHQSITKSLYPSYFKQEMFSKNNITLLSHRIGNSIPDVTVYEYEYNANGYPTKKTIEQNSLVLSSEEYEY